MKCFFLLIFAVTVQCQQTTPNFTIPENLLNDLTNLLVDSFTNNSVSLTDVLSSNALQDLFDYYGYDQAALPIDGLNGAINLLSQLEKLQLILDELAARQDECSRQLTLFFTSLRKNEDWALRMIDAWAKPQPGFLEGNIILTGHFDECMKIDSIANGTKINGQYCTALIADFADDKVDVVKVNVISLHLAYGLCVPDVCDLATLQGVIRLFEQRLNSPYHFNLAEELCISSVKSKPVSALLISVIIFFTAIGVIVVSSTLYDIYFYQNRKDRTQQDVDIRIAFSFYTNGRKLFSTKKSADSLGCLNGLRVISMAWIVLGHRFMYTLSVPLINLVDVSKWSEIPISVLVTSGTMGVDTFLLISGLLVVYVYLNYKEKGHAPSLPMFYIHRILRLTPPLAALVLLYCVIFEYAGSGPFWPITNAIFGEDCKEYWWTTLLFIHNYIHPMHLCIGQTWYLAVDTQLYFLFPLLLLALSKGPKYMLLLIFSLIVCCCGLTFYISWVKNLIPSFYGLDDDNLKYLYIPTHVRAPSWLIGVVLGYFLYNIRNKKIKINKKFVIVLWLAALAVLAGIVAYHSKFSTGLVKNITRLESAFINALMRPCWSLALSIIIFLCVTGYGGIVNRFLSSGIFTVLIRINYAVYLLHAMVILFALAQEKTPVSASFIETLYMFWGDLVLSSLLATVWTLTFESPIFILEKIIFGKRKPKTKAVEEVPAKYTNNNIAVVVVDDKLDKENPSNG